MSTTEAPARRIEVSASRTQRRRSTHPFAAAAREVANVPVAAYQVSGEYAMLEAAATMSR